MLEEELHQCFGSLKHSVMDHLELSMLLLEESGVACLQQYLHELSI